MRPNYKIIADGQDITHKMNDKLVSLSIEDHAGIKSDKLKITLSDHPEIDRPKKGVRLEVALGYEDVLVDMGSFTVTGDEGKSPSPEITVIATAISGHKTLVDQREISWKNTSLGKIALEIAERNSLSLAISDDLSNIPIDHIDQTESDSSFLHRLSKRFDAVYKISSNHLIFSPKEEVLTASGKRLPMVHIKSHKSYSFASSMEKAYTGVRTYWWNNKKAKRESVLIGEEGVVYENEYTQKNNVVAKTIAESTFKRISRSKDTLNLVVAGNQQLFAERQCNVKGVRSDIDGIWMIESVTHTINQSGYTTSVELKGKRK